jgi:hypothetical protein
VIHSRDQVDFSLQNEHQVKYHEEDNKIIVSYHQDISEHLKIAKAERDLDSRVKKKHEFRKVMTVPFNVIQKIANETGLDFLNPDHSKDFYKVLKRHEYRELRTVQDNRL